MVEIPIIDMRIKYSDQLLCPIAFFPSNKYIDEEWRFIYYPKIPDIIPNRYMVSNYGRVWDCFRQRFLIQSNSNIFKNSRYKKGYNTVNLEKIFWPDNIQNISYIYQGTKFVSVLVHILVLSTFNYIEGCENLQVNHKDLNKTNNNLSNLEWLTPLENYYHAVDNGALSIYSEDNISAKELANICIDLENKISPEDIANKYNRDLRIIYKIACKEIYSKFSDYYDIPKYTNPYKAKKTDEGTVHKICSELESGTRIVDICKKYNVKKYVVDMILDKKSYIEISNQYMLPARKKSLTRHQADKIGLLISQGYTDENIANMLGVNRSIVYNIKTGTTYPEIRKKYNITYECQSYTDPIVPQLKRDIAKYLRSHPLMCAAMYDKKVAEKFGVVWYTVRDIRLAL